MKSLKITQHPFLIFYGFLLFIFTPFHISAQQLATDFNQLVWGDKWKGDTAKFILNAPSLQSNSNLPNDAFGVDFPILLKDTMEWNITLKLPLNTSSKNYVDLVLFTALNAPTYFIRMGDTKDEISLYKDSKTGVEKLIDGADGVMNAYDDFQIQLIKKGQNAFVNGKFGKNSSFQSLGSFFIGSSSDTGFFSYKVSQSTASFFGKHFLNNLYIGPILKDTLPPSIQNVKIIGSNQLQLHFSESLDTTALTVGNWDLDGLKKPKVWVESPQVIHLKFPNSFSNNHTYRLQLKDWKDTAGNIITDTLLMFKYLVGMQPKWQQLRVTELLPDPIPSCGLPLVEFVEVYNPGPEIINMEGVVLTDGQSFMELDSILLFPDSLLLLADNKGCDSLKMFGKCVGSSNFPSLNNSADRLVLFHKSGDTLDWVSYNSTYYENGKAKEGGISLALIHSHITPNTYCGGQPNWKTSHQSDGGSPGKVNPEFGKVKSKQKPHILSATIVDPQLLKLHFNEMPDTTAAQNLFFSSDLKNGFWNEDTFWLHFINPIARGTHINCNVELTDCDGHLLDSSFQLFFPDTLVPGDLLINEVLYDPIGDEGDFVEFINVSNKTIDLGMLGVSRYKDGGWEDSANFLFKKGNYLRPNQIIALVEDSLSILKRYQPSNGFNLRASDQLPGLTNQEGNVVIYAKGPKSHMEIDALSYTDDFHFELIKNSEGVSLERISTAVPTQVPDNWTSASASVRYATPGYQNSQYKPTQPQIQKLELSQRIVSPDGDGYEDQVHIYLNDYSGYHAHIWVFHPTGVPLLHFKNNVLLGTSNTFTWNGLDLEGNKLPIGNYAIVAEVFNAKGDVQMLKAVITVGGRL